MANAFDLHYIKIKTEQRFHSSQNCLYSNQIEHLQSELLSEQRCAFVLVAGLHAGVYSRDHLLAVRFLPKSWTPHFNGRKLSESTLETLIETELQQLQQRKKMMLSDAAEAYRWVHGDADGLPGIVVDDYGEIVVVQSNSHAGDFLLPNLLNALGRVSDKPIFERSSGQIRALEKLPERTRWVRAPEPSQKQDEVHTTLAGLRMIFRPQRCQKTGLFLDQRENLLLLQKILSSISARTMLDLCSYAGAWSCAAAQAGVAAYTAVDQDKDALELCELNIKNNLSPATPAPDIHLLHGDLFEILSKLNRDEKSFDIVVADPPAFTKSSKHVPEARRAYQRLAKLSSRLVAPNGLLVACSCSRHIDEEDFYEIVSSALVADDWVYLGRGRQSPDHTVLATDKHSLYLKALFFMRRSTLAHFTQAQAQRRGENP
ncbi:MAG: class I SAM-dependent rRNA methyltransferase [Betaproteobacteria bacterium]|nr:class I SAM-dependent rRNA methyltransferase [Betaproteobacteria bacterium]